jgi:hypothetical protein
MTAALVEAGVTCDAAIRVADRLAPTPASLLANARAQLDRCAALPSSDDEELPFSPPDRRDVCAGEQVRAAGGPDVAVDLGAARR